MKSVEFIVKGTPTWNSDDKRLVSHDHTQEPVPSTKGSLMDSVKATCDTVLTCWHRSANYRKAIRHLGENLAALECKMGELHGVYNDVNRLVENAEGEGWIRKDDTARWLKKVEDLNCKKLDPPMGI